MSKGTLYVVTYSVVILVLFCIFCFLMTSVNPEPLVVVRSTIGNSSSRRRSYEQENIYFNDVEMPAVYVSPEYGLDKVSDESLYTYTLAKVSSAKIIDTEGYKTQTTKLNKSQNITTTAADGSTSTIHLKGHRRSINNFEEFDGVVKKPGDVLLKIMDDSGQPLIEIKLGPNGSLQMKKPRKKSNHIKINSKTNDSEQFYESELTNTIIKIMPINDVLVEEFEQNSNRNTGTTKAMGCSDRKDIIPKTSLSGNIVLTDENHMDMLSITPVNALNLTTAYKMLFDKELKVPVTFNNQSTYVRNATENNIHDLINRTTSAENVHFTAEKMIKNYTKEYSTPIFESKVIKEHNKRNQTTKLIPPDHLNVMKVFNKQYINSRTKSATAK